MSLSGEELIPKRTELSKVLQLQSRDVGFHSNPGSTTPRPLATSASGSQPVVPGPAAAAPGNELERPLLEAPQTYRISTLQVVLGRFEV